MSAAHAFLELAISSYGERRIDGVVVIRRSQKEMAADLGMSRGTVAKYLRRLRPVVAVTAAGIVVDTTRRAPEGGRAGGASARRAPGAPPEKGAPAPDCAKGIGAGQRGCGLPDDPGAPPEKGAPARQLASFSFSKRPKKLASSAEDAPFSGGAPGLPASTDEQIDEALAPLLAVLAVAGPRCSPPIPTTLNANGYRQLSKFPQAGVAFAGAEALAQFRAGRARSPLGLLVCKASGDVVEFFTPPAAVPPPAQAVVAEAPPPTPLVDQRVRLGALRASLTGVVPA